MGARKAKASSDKTWAKLLKTQRKLLRAWVPGGGQELPGPPVMSGFPFAADPAAPLPFGFTNPFAASPQGGFPGGFNPWLSPGSSTTELFNLASAPWLQSLMQYWPQLATTLQQLGKQAADSRAFDWQGGIDQAFAAGKATFELYEKNIRDQIMQLLCMGQSVDPALRKHLELHIPATGLFQKEHESVKKTQQLLLDVQETAQQHNELLAGLGAEVLDVMRDRLLVMQEEKQSLSSLRACFHLWVECCEQVYRDRVSNKHYAERYGAMMNACFRLRKHLQEQQGLGLESLGLPSRRELDAVHKDLRQLHEQLDTLQQHFSQQQGQLDALQQQFSQQQGQLDALQQQFTQQQAQPDTNPAAHYRHD